LDQVGQLEDDIDRFDQGLPALHEFILPGGSRASAAVHAARAVCRRAERRVVHLAAMPDQGVSPHVIAYLNRLSDLLFVIARAVNAAVGQADVLWKSPSDPSTGRGA
jgi:cob(I)alamin adenosyltransferase